MKDGIARSPLFYVGDKYKLVREIRTHLPQRIGRLIEPFVGGGSVMMNVEADRYLLNDIDRNVIALHRMLAAYVGREEEFYVELYQLIDHYGLSLSYRADVVPEELKRANPKTYYARYNKAGYQQMKADYIAVSTAGACSTCRLATWTSIRMYAMRCRTIFGWLARSVWIGTTKISVSSLTASAIRKATWYISTRRI